MMSGRSSADNDGIITPSTARVLAVDVCGTLFDANTTAGLIQHHHRRMDNWKRGLLLTLITGRRQPLRAACIIFAKLTGFDVHRAITLGTLRGQTRLEVEASAQSYLKVLEMQRIEVVHDRVRQMQIDGWSPLLVSNSISMIVGPIAATLGVPYVSSQVGWMDGYCTGRLETDLTGRKKQFLEQFLGRSLTPRQFSVITDNRSDADLIDAAQHAILISKKERKDWMNKENAEVLDV